jgi:hypothetical protein
VPRPLSPQSCLLVFSLPPSDCTHCVLFAGSALQHYAETGNKYPLAVKLGTITPHSADVFSYAADENDVVIDPLLPQHLAHWGIDQAKLEKTAKTMAELQARGPQVMPLDVPHRCPLTCPIAAKAIASSVLVPGVEFWYHSSPR